MAPSRTSKEKRGGPRRRHSRPTGASPSLSSSLSSPSRPSSSSSKGLGIDRIGFRSHPSHAKQQSPTLARYASMDAQAVVAELKSLPNGLTQREADARVRHVGLNTVSVRRESAFFAFLRQFLNPLIILLIGAAFVSHFSDPNSIDAYIIGAIVLLSVVINFTQEYRASSAAARLQERVATSAAVIRDGVERELHIAHLVPGDVLMLRAGDLIPADCRIIESKDLFVNESSLTGESLPAEKHAPAITHGNPSLSEMTNIVFSGSSVVSGSARVVVVHTGKDTAFGRVVSDLTAPSVTGAFDQGVRAFSFLIIRAIIALVIFIFFVLALVKHEYLSAILFSIAVAVGLAPGLLPMILSVTMARGSVNMAKRGVIVKKLTSIPNFGSMDVLCTDKTGTLTQDRIELVRYINLSGREDEHVLLYTYLNSLHQTGIHNPLDRAVLEFKRPEAIRTVDYVKVDEIPFDFVRRRVSIVAAKRDTKILITKGAPEEVIKCCSHYRLNGEDALLRSHEQRRAIWSHYTRLSEDGHRVLAIAIKYLHDGPKRVYRKEDEEGMTFVGFVAFLDPPKPDVKHVLLDLQRMGIDVKVVTGDNELVTKKICSEIGLVVKGVLLGGEVDAYDDAELRAKVETTTIFARFSPSQKNRVIVALKANGHVVGYLGDGINDAPSLRTADVGISVEGATDIARESADIILTHKSLKELKDGVIEGRKTFGNSMKYLMMSVSSNFGNMFSVAGAVVMLPFLPMLPVMILFNNLLYDISQATIPLDSVDDEYIERPKRWDMGFITKFMYVFGPISSLFDFITFGTLYWVFGTPAAVFQTGWFLESLATQTLVIHIIRTKKTPFIESRASPLVLFSTIGVVILGWCIPFTPLGAYLGFTPIPLPILFVLGGFVLAYLILVQIVKTWFYKRYTF